MCSDHQGLEKSHGKELGHALNPQTGPAASAVEKLVPFPQGSRMSWRQQLLLSEATEWVWRRRDNMSGMQAAMVKERNTKHHFESQS